LNLLARGGGVSGRLLAVGCSVSAVVSIIFGPVVDACAAKFLARIAKLLQEPRNLV
jgi:hypothetical protein